MFGKRLWIAVVWVVAVLGPSAVAQDEKNDIGGMIGRTFISDQGIQNATYFDPIIHSGNGLTFEGEYARRFFVTPVFAISAEGLLAYNHEEKLNAGEVAARAARLLHLMRDRSALAGIGVMGPGLRRDDAERLCDTLHAASAARIIRARSEVRYGLASSSRAQLSLLVSCIFLSTTQGVEGRRLLCPSPASGDDATLTAARC